jgi:ubiquitin-protein ligase E3 A
VSQALTLRLFARRSAAFLADVASLLGPLSAKRGLSAGEAAAAALRAACGATYAPLSPNQVEAAVASADPAAIARALTAALTPDVLVRSFLLSDDASDEDGDASPLTMPSEVAAAHAALSMDLRAACAAFDALEEARCDAGDDDLDTAFAHALDEINISLELLPPPAPLAAGDAAMPDGDREARHALACVRCGLLLLLCCATLRDPSYHSQLDALLRSLAALPPAAALLARRALRALPGDRFREVLELLQGFLLAELYEGEGSAWMTGAGTSPAEPLHAAATVLSWLHAANAAAPKGLRLPASAFHNDALNDPAWTDEPRPPPGTPPGVPVHLGPYPLGDDWAAWHSGNARAFSFLRSAPFLYSPAAKARVLALECAQRQRGALGDALLRGMMLAGGGGAAGCPYCVLRVRRDRLLADAAREIAAAARTRQLHKPLKVVFAGEEGVDEGGVQKEFFTLVARQIFSPDYGMWSPVDSAGRITWFAPGGLEVAGEADYELVGWLLGLALYNSVLMELALPRAAYALLLGGAPESLEDLADVAPETAAGLAATLAAAEADPAGFEAAFALTWTAGYDCLGARREAELCPGGAGRAVTGAEAPAFAAAYAAWLLKAGVARQAAAFARGFATVLRAGTPPRATAILSPEELEALLVGDPSLDFNALEAAAEYVPPLHADAPLARHFWAAAHALGPEDKKRLLAFVTGSDRVPIGGLREIPLRLQRNGDGDARLPTAHTCFNTLMLPEYSGADAMRERLGVALANHEGFGLR